MIKTNNLYLISFVVIFFVQTFKCLGQYDDFSYLNFGNFGIAYPLGAIGKTQSQNLRSGYAQIGFEFDIGAKYYKEGRKYGYILSGYFQYFPTDHGEMLDERSRRTPNSGDIREGYWQNMGFLVGAFKIFPLLENLSIESGGLVGLSNTKSPNLRAHNLDGPPGYPHSITMNSSESFFNFSFMIKTSLKYDINKFFCVFSNIDFLGLSPRFDNREITYNFFWHQEELSFRQPFYTINFTVGVGYLFKYK
jgi:hypothetical protein